MMNILRLIQVRIQSQPCQTHLKALVIGCPGPQSSSADAGSIRYLRSTSNLGGHLSHWSCATVMTSFKQDTITMVSAQVTQIAPRT